MTAMEGRLVSFIEDRRDDLIRFTQNLVRAQSVNPPGSEAGLAEVVVRELERFGIPCHVFDHGNGRASVVGVVKGGDGGRLMFNGHADTVPVGDVSWQHDPFGGDIEDGRLYGRGASDMKSGVASMIYAAAALAGCSVALKGDVLIAVAAGEEVDSIGAWAVARSEWGQGIEQMLISEPSDLDIYVAEKGALWLNIKAHGKTAHGAMPEHGVNAVEHLIDLLGVVRRDLRARFDRHDHGLLGKATVSVNTMAGGIKTNVVPDMAEATLDIRTLPVQDHEEILAHVREQVQETQGRFKGLTMECSVINDRAAYEIKSDHSAVRNLQSVISEATGRSPSVSGVAYYTDASVFWPARRCPIVICGPGRAALAHQPEEYVEVSKVVDAAKVYAIWGHRLQAQE